MQKQKSVLLDFELFLLIVNILLLLLLLLFVAARSVEVFCCYIFYLYNRSFVVRFSCCCCKVNVLCRIFSFLRAVVHRRPSCFKTFDLCYFSEVLCYFFSLSLPFSSCVLRLLLAANLTGWLVGCLILVYSSIWLFCAGSEMAN